MTYGSSRGTRRPDSQRRSVWQRFRNRSHREKPVLITTARITRSQDRKKREWWYGFLQFLRVPLTLACVGMYLAWDWVLIPVILASLTFPLPWIAVMIANMEGTPKDKRQPRMYKPAIARQADRNTMQQIDTSGTGQHAGQAQQALPPGIIDTTPHDSAAESDD